MATTSAFGVAVPTLGDDPNIPRDLVSLSNTLSARNTRPIFGTAAERDAAYSGAGMTLITGMRCMVNGVNQIVRNGAWSVENQTGNMTYIRADNNWLVPDNFPYGLGVIDPFYASAYGAQPCYITPGTNDWLRTYTDGIYVASFKAYYYMSDNTGYARLYTPTETATSGFDNQGRANITCHGSALAGQDFHCELYQHAGGSKIFGWHFSVSRVA